jgi:hypothetical protein
MAKLSTDYRSAVLHPREAIFSTATLGSNGAETIIDCDGCGVVSVDMRGTFSLTLEVSGTVDGTNWTPIPVRPRNIAAVLYVAAIVGTAPLTWVGDCTGYRKVRARVTAYTSGAAVTTLAANIGLLDQVLSGRVIATQTATGAAAAAVTLTLTAPGAGLRHYLSYLVVERHASALLTAGATPVLVTTTNIPTSLVFSFPADAAAQGTVHEKKRDFPDPLATAAQNTNTTIVCPVTTGVIWRVEVGFYVAP